MKLEMSTVSARAMRDLGSLSPDLERRIGRVDTKADRCVLEVPVSDLRRTRDVLRALVEAGGQHDAPFYHDLLSRVEYFVDLDG